VASPNVEAVRRATDAFRRRDMEAMLREAAPDIEISDPERAGPGPFRGHDAFVAWLEEWLESWETYDAEVEAFVDLQDRVVALVHHRGRARGSGVEIDHRGALVNTVRDGKIAHYQPFTHVDQALEAAGLADGGMWDAAIQRILAGYEAWNRRDVDALTKLFDSDMEFVPISQSIMPAFRGREGMEGFAAASADAWEEFVFAPIAFMPLRDRLLVDLEVRGVGRESGIALEEHWAHVYTIQDGRVARFHAFRSRDEALEALAYPDRS
jgi:uncharacterized protein